MAFCNSCGATLTEGTQFCTKCGAAVGGNPSDMSTARPVETPLPAPPPSKGSSSALRIILLIVGAVVLISILGMVTCGIVLHRAMKNARFSRSGDNVKVETPFGSMETSQDTDKIAKDLGIDIYPGAEMQKAGSASVTFGSRHTVTGTFESSDSADKVCTFYRSKFPSANVTSSNEGRCSIISSAPPNMVTISIEPRGDGAKFVIMSVSKNAASN
jgi:hypothetical protein